MDMSSFPQMIKFKQKIILNPQLLRWVEWFSKYSFDCKYIKGKNNILAYLLTRSNPNRTQIMMYKASSSQSKVPAKKLKKNPESAFNIPPNLNPEFPPEVYRLILENKFHSKAKDMIFEYQLEVFRNYGDLMLNPLGLHPDYPFIHPIHFKIINVPDELKWLLWYFTHIYQVAIQFVLLDLLHFIDQAIDGTEPLITKKLAVILKWFFSLSHWKDIIEQAATQNEGYFIIIIFYKPRYFLQHGNAKQLGSFPSTHIHSIQWEDDTWPEDLSLLTPYHKAITEAQKQYKDGIPDPSEWSQDYTLYESSASKIKEPKEDSNDHMETVFEDESTSINSAQLPHSNRD
ncbi:hypothetical protein V6N11_010390 [Hibiscus sabdariffa]|uniref:Uncharacterized protein n=1 Tax=Hibiscus sabdariffa TaxID=183260 RepID=A0ABR2S560_9ROSI